MTPYRFTLLPAIARRLHHCRDLGESEPFDFLTLFTSPNWVALSGRIDGQDVSSAVFCSPKNFRAPQSVRINPNKPYFCFSPMVEGPFKIAPGEDYVSRYRYLVTSKGADVNMIQKHWDEYSRLFGPSF